MMCAANLRDFDRSSDPARRDWTWVGAIFVERKMGARSMVVSTYRHDAAQMALVEDQSMIQKLAANRAYDPLDVGVLPR